MMLSPQQVAQYQEQGFVRIEQVYSPAELEAMDRALAMLMEQWAQTDQGWTGPWRKAYMDAATERKSKLTSLHDLHFYSEAWFKAVTHPKVVAAMVDLLGPNVELHHSTLHAKPPESGHPFPMHQDSAFYRHQDGRYVDVLVHLDDTCHANGEIRFLAGSQKAGHLEHIERTADGPCTPHLPTDAYRLEDTVPVPARRGDIVCFQIHTIHGSYINTTDRVRRMIRVGYRDPDNMQLAGQSVGRPGLMLNGFRSRRPHHAAAFTTDAVA